MVTIVVIAVATRINAKSKATFTATFKATEGSVIIMFIIKVDLVAKQAA